MQAATFKRVVAVEPTPSLADTCRTRGVEVIQSTIEQARLEHGVDVVVSFEVIEHLFDPAAFVVRCRDVLRSRGLLVLTCPNIQGFDIDVLGPVSPAIDVEHLNYFHPASLSALLVSHGFEVLETSTPGIHAVGDVNTYPGKRKLIVCGFHEATLAAFAIGERVFPDRALPLLYTTTSTRLPICASPAARFTVVVVLPTPPF